MTPVSPHRPHCAPAGAAWRPLWRSWRPRVRSCTRYPGGCGAAGGWGASPGLCHLPPWGLRVGPARHPGSRARAHTACPALPQVVSSILRNLSWRADISSKKVLREVGSMTALMQCVLRASKVGTGRAGGGHGCAVPATWPGGTGSRWRARHLGGKSSQTDNPPPGSGSRPGASNPATQKILPWPAVLLLTSTRKGIWVPCVGASRERARGWGGAGARTADPLLLLPRAQESTLKSVLSALWNLSAHSTENKAAICQVDGALGFLVSTLTYKCQSNSLAIIESGGGILRNVSSLIATREDYRSAGGAGEGAGQVEPGSSWGGGGGSPSAVNHGEPSLVLLRMGRPDASPVADCS